MVLIQKINLPRKQQDNNSRTVSTTTQIVVMDTSLLTGDFASIIVILATAVQHYLFRTHTESVFLSCCSLNRFLSIFK